MSSIVFNTKYITQLAVCAFILSALLAICFKISSMLAAPSKPQKPTIVNLLTRHTPVQDIVLAKLDIVGVVSLSRTTKTFKGYVKLVERTQFNTDARLNHFATSPGTFVYSFMVSKAFGRITGRRQLDTLLVQKGSNAAALQHFLESDVSKSLVGPVPGISIGLMQHRTMRRTAINGHICDINITETHNTPVFGLLHCPMAFLLTFISWNRAYSILPYETFVDKKIYLLQRVEKVTTAYWQAAENAGLEVLPIAQFNAMYENALSKTSVLGVRRIGDAHSWIIPLKTSSTANSSPYLSHIVDFASFEIVTTYRGSSSTFSHYCTCTRIIRQLSLRYQYVTCRITGTLENWPRDVAITSLHYLPVTEQPQQLSQLFVGSDIDRLVMVSLDGFTPPECSKWKYYDEEMTKYLEKQYPKPKQALDR